MLKRRGLAEDVATGKKLNIESKKLIKVNKEK